MALATKPASSAPRRVWKAPSTKAWWIWLAASLLLYGSVYALYLIAIKTQPFPGPFNDPLRSFGILAFVLVLAAATYSLRRRFVRGLPGMARDWLWMHTWIGITAVLIALLHENYAHILHDYFQHAYETLVTRASLVQSLQKQKRARLIIRTWRLVHIVLACLALLIILYHGVMELLTNVLHIITPA